MRTKFSERKTTLFNKTRDTIITRSGKKRSAYSMAKGQILKSGWITRLDLLPFFFSKKFLFIFLSFYNLSSKTKLKSRPVPSRPRSRATLAQGSPVPAFPHSRFPQSRSLQTRFARYVLPLFARVASLFFLGSQLRRHIGRVARTRLIFNFFLFYP